jgi:hypothetical protein
LPNKNHMHLFGEFHFTANQPLAIKCHWHLTSSHLFSILILFITIIDILHIPPYLFLKLNIFITFLYPWFFLLPCFKKGQNNILYSYYICYYAFLHLGFPNIKITLARLANFGNVKLSSVVLLFGNWFGLSLSWWTFVCITSFIIIYHATNTCIKAIHQLTYVYINK